MIKKRVLHSLITLITMFGFIFMLSPSLKASAQEETAPVPNEILDTLSPEEQVIIKRIAPTIKDSWGPSLGRDLEELEKSMNVLTPLETAKMTLIQNEFDRRERAILQDEATQKQDNEELFFNLAIVLIVAIIFIVVFLSVCFIVYSFYKFVKQHNAKKKDVKIHDVT